MSAGAHGLQPAGHEHVHCRFCGANGVHVYDRPDGEVVYAAHPRKGSTVQCLKSCGRTALPEHRHQGDPR